jgi:hypothetical protein
MIDHWQILHYVPAHAIAGGVIPMLQFTGKSLGKRRLAQKKQQLREHLLALNNFIMSMRDVPETNEYHTPGLQGALDERDLLLRRLASLHSLSDQPQRQTVNVARRLFLLYSATRPVGWLLHWMFFTLLIVTIAGAIRGLLHVNYLPVPVLIPFLFVTSALTVLVRVAAFYLGRQTNRRSDVNRGLAMSLAWLIGVVLSLHIGGLAQLSAQTKGPIKTLPSLQVEERFGPKNPYMASGGAAAEHDDPYSSDVSPLPGPGIGPVDITMTKLGAICPTVVLGSRENVFVYCIDIETRHASLRLLAPDNLAVLASLDMPTSGRLGGFYMYVDQKDRVVVGTGDNHLLRIRAVQDSTGRWRLSIVNNWDLSRQVTGHCGSKDCDYLESVTPDWTGKIWFSTEAGVVGIADSDTGVVRSVRLPQGEHVANSISASPDGAAVASDHALYLFGLKPDRIPTVRWRETYDRGTRTKLGRLSQGTGTTPVFFGREGHPYLAITDNNDSQESLLVYRVKAAAGQRLVCKVPLFSAEASAAENAPIGIADSVVASNTYGYDYDNYTGRELKPLPGGLTRVDVRSDGSGCDTVWSNPVPVATVPKLSIFDGNIYTVERFLKGSTPQYLFAAIDFQTGKTVTEKLIGDSYALDTHELATTIAPHGTLYQPTISAIIKVWSLSETP